MIFSAIVIVGRSKGYLISKNQARHAVGERDLLADCNHPGVVALYGYFQVGLTMLSSTSNCVVIHL